MTDTEETGVDQESDGNSVLSWLATIVVVGILLRGLIYFLEHGTGTVECAGDCPTPSEVFPAVAIGTMIVAVSVVAFLKVEMILSGDPDDY